MKEKERKRILVAVNNDLLTDARVHRACSSLHAAGYEVELIGRLLPEGNSPLSRPYRTRRFPMRIRKGPLFYAEFNLKLYRTLRKLQGDAILCNDTDALLACYTAARRKHIPLLFDAHELFPELPEVVGRPWVRRTWQALENYIFPKLRYSYTVCQSIAEYYRNRYGIRMSVVRNIPQREKAPLKNTVPPAHTQQNTPEISIPPGMKMLLYQGTVNIGRGIEWILSAMPLLPDCILYICGAGDCLQEMQQMAARSAAADRIRFTGRIPQEQLKYYTLRADLGFVLLEKLGLSYYYALPNRMFDYMHYGVPVLATDFPEIRRIVEEAGSGSLIDRYEPEYVAARIRDMLQAWSAPEQRAALRRRAESYCWENVANSLIALVETAQSRRKTDKRHLSQKHRA